MKINNFFIIGLMTICLNSMAMKNDDTTIKQDLENHLKNVPAKKLKTEILNFQHKLVTAISELEKYFPNEINLKKQFDEALVFLNTASKK